MPVSITITPLVSNSVTDTGKLLSLIESRVPELRAYTLGLCRAGGDAEKKVSYHTALSQVLAFMAYIITQNEEYALHDYSNDHHEINALPTR